MTLRSLFLIFAVMLVPVAGHADPRLMTPSPDMSDADLRKSCSAEAGRVHKSTRGLSARGYASVEQYRALRREYRKDCISKAKQQRRSRLAGAGLPVPACAPAAAGPDGAGRTDGSCAPSA
jgi:hypothetical protein